MTLPEALILHLEAAGQLAGTEPFFGLLPEAPDRAICLMSRDMKSPARVQVYVRGAPGEIWWPFQKALALCGVLDGFSGYLCGDGPRVIIETSVCAQGMGQDLRGRHLYLCVLDIWHCEEDTWQEDEKTAVPYPSGTG